mmetsp:Transcript_50894/g.85053  ORF Transcript_50894/g.85053 Transcript_50894/m.85053 type:complete len:213 (-) Transcript_50894:479-1117(-)
MRVCAGRGSAFLPTCTASVPPSTICFWRFTSVGCGLLNAPSMILCKGLCRISYQRGLPCEGGSTPCLLTRRCLFSRLGGRASDETFVCFKQRSLCHVIGDDAHESGTGCLREEVVYSADSANFMFCEQTSSFLIRSPFFPPQSVFVTVSPPVCPLNSVLEMHGTLSTAHCFTATRFVLIPPWVPYEPVGFNEWVSPRNSGVWSMDYGSSRGT